MAQSRELNLRNLNDPDRYKGVSPETRTAVIGAIGIDVEGLTIQEGGKFTDQELATGLRYLLVQNEHLHPYMITSAEDPRSMRLDPFYVPNRTDWLLLANMNPPSIHGISDDGHHAGHCSGGDAEALLICLAVTAACACCFGASYHSYKMTNNDETNTTKTLKLASNGLSFLVPAGIAFYVAMKLFDEKDPYYYVSAATASFFVGATVALLTSYINRIECTSQSKNPLDNPPSDELLAELGTAKGILEGKHKTDHDDPAMYTLFIRDVVRFYIHQIAKTPALEIRDEHTALLPKGFGNNPMTLLPPPAMSTTYPQFDAAKPANASKPSSFI